MSASCEPFKPIESTVFVKSNVQNILSLQLYQLVSQKMIVYTEANSFLRSWSTLKKSGALREAAGQQSSTYGTRCHHYIALDAVVCDAVVCRDLGRIV